MTAQKVIEALPQALSGVKFVLQSTAEHESLSRSAYWSALLSDTIPACTMLLKTAEEVSVLIKTFEPFVLAGEAKLAI